MAIYNEILSARFARMLQRIFSMKGEQAMKQLAGELMPVFPFFNGVENRYLEGWQRYGGIISLAAGGAGNISKWRLRNPNRNTVAVFEKITICNNNAGSTNYIVTIAGAITTDLGTLQSNANTQLDLRGPNNSSLSLSFENNTATSISGIAIFDATTAINAVNDVILTENQEVILAAGNVGGPALQFSASANSALLATVIWRERTLEESEQGP